MVIAGIGALASLGLALPTGLAFGYGYGYGVRQGYHAFRPSKSSVTKDLHLSANPIEGAKGAGMLSAEEMTSKQATNINPTFPATPQPTPQTTGQSLVSSPQLTHDEKLKKHNALVSNDGSVTINSTRKLTHEEYLAFKKKNIIPNDLKTSKNWY